MDDYEANPEKYEGKKLSELSDDEDYDEEKDIIHTEAYYKKTKLPKVILVRFSFLVWSVVESLFSPFPD